MHIPDIHVHYHQCDPEVSKRLDEMAADLKQIIQQGVSMSEQLDAVKADLDEVKADLDTIKAAVASALEVEKQQADQIVALTQQLDALRAGEALTEQQITALKDSADALKDQSQSVVDALTPVAPPPA